jgi:hypothetical protein
MKCAISKEEVLRQAREQGIIDLDIVNGNVSLDSIMLATELMKKHGQKAYEEIEKRRKEQSDKRD